METKIEHRTNGHDRPQRRASREGENGLAAIDRMLDANGAGMSPAELAAVWSRRAKALAVAPPKDATGESLDMLLFRLSDERYGIPVSGVREIHRLEQLTPVPRTPDFVAGVFSARGRILSIIDLRAYFGLARLAVSDQTKIIVVANTDLASETADLEVGLLADEVTDVAPIFKDDIAPPLATQSGARTKYIQGITPDLLVVLNLNALLRDEELIVQEEL